MKDEENKTRLSRVERNKREQEEKERGKQNNANYDTFVDSDEEDNKRLSRVERNKQPREKRFEADPDLENETNDDVEADIEQDTEEEQVQEESDQKQRLRKKSRRFMKDNQEQEEKQNKDSVSQEIRDDLDSSEKIKRKQRSGQDKKERKKFFTWKRWITLIGVLFVCGLIGYTTIIYGGKMLVSEEKLTITPPTTIETADGEIIKYLYDEFRLPVNIDQIPDHVQDAFVTIEDKRFYQHTGVDYRAIMRAIYRDIITRSKAEGASTLTQQLAKNLFLTNDKTFLRKTKEIMIALYIEREYSKDDILEMYLNAVYFGQGQYGIEAAANKYFYKSVDELTLEEAALLAGMVKAPNGYSPIDHPEKAKERRDLVLQTMFAEEKITEDELMTALDKDLGLNVSSRKQNVAYDAYVDIVLKELKEKYGITGEELREKRYKIVTAFKPEFQEIAYEYFQTDHYFPGSNDDVEGAFVLLDKTGRLLTAVGSRDFIIGNMNFATTKWQPGSAIKPLVAYAPALMTEQFDAYSMVPDEKKHWPGWDDGKEVTNANGEYAGQLPLYESLKQSKNTTAVWLLDQIGVKNGIKYLKELGIPLHEKDDGLAIALGGLTKGVTPVQMAQAYTSFLNGGKVSEAYAVESISDFKGKVLHENQGEQTEVFSNQVAWTMTEMLKQVVTSGTAASGDYPYDLAGKTGSTQNDYVEGATKDAWFVGYTPEYVSALWMGYEYANEENYLTGGSSYPTVLTKNILSEMNKKVELKQSFEKPKGVVAMEDPIELPIIEDIDGKYIFGGWKIVKGKLSWNVSHDDERVVYRIYTYEDEESELVGEVTGETEFELESVSLFNQKLYYVVPFNPQTEEEGNRSEVIPLRF